MKHALSSRLVLICVALLALSACKKRPRYLVGDHLIPMGSSDPNQIVTIVEVDPDGYKVSNAPSPRPNDPVQTKTRREIESYYVRVDLPVGGSWLTEEDRAAAVAKLRTPTAAPTATPTSTPAPSATAAEATPALSATADPEALGPQIRPAMGMISTFDLSGKLLRNATGFFITPEGRFVTTADAVAGAANGIVKVQSGAIYNVVGVLAESTVSDVAVVKVEANTVPFLALSEAPTIQAGESVLIADTILRRRENAIVLAKITEVRSDHGGEALQLGGEKLQVSAGAAVINAKGEVIGCVTHDETGPQVRAVRSLPAINAVLSRVTANVIPTWPVAPRSPTPMPTPGSASGEAVLLYAPLPKYPTNARFSYGAPPSGTGRYTVKFGADGRPTGIVILQSTGSQALDSAAVDALRLWRAKPGAPSQRTVPITFRRP